MTSPKCTQCGNTDLFPGFIVDRGSQAGNFNVWVEGQLERGAFGGAKAMGRPKWEVDAHRCQRCGHLELFAIRPL
ncbi:MAG TPA: hypothetical protein VE172_15785 [Stackebrandtia sp.]|jgi:predicted nucleic-acid-binding Zn-ribbon protein|uniref:hypothetical protein n=1 Tax=Stackebrandtia sp. TaxID=2023065 RepID=UPI002D6A9027|nr:hypothetical protein [Stackebrandtia sp.]HZE40265.1 hypothetical protein [Stackebrandtia sp.]